MNRSGIAAMLSTDTNLEPVSAGAAQFCTHAYKFPDAGYIQGLERILRKNLTINVFR